MPGPAPKRDAERRRVNARPVPTATVDIEALEAEGPDDLPWLIKQPIVIPAVPTRTAVREVDGEKVEVEEEYWHPIAKELWESLKSSGQAMFWEPSDWMVAKLVCESISRDLKPQVVGILQPSDQGPGEVLRERIPLKGASLGAYLKAFGQLMMTEGDRRRVAIELNRERLKAGLAPDLTDVIPITDRRKAKLLAEQAKREA